MSFLTSREQVAPQGIGKPVKRREDARLLTGGGRFADDMSLPVQSTAAIPASANASSGTCFRTDCRAVDEVVTVVMSCSSRAVLRREDYWGAQPKRDQTLSYSAEMSLLV